MSSTRVKLPAPREPPPPLVPVQCRQFFMLHPAFKQPTKILRWYASAVGPERNPNAPETYAFPCDIAVEACVIVARNKRGQLYHQESGSIGQKVTTSMILPGTYYFLLDGQDSSYRYKVCWEFKYWTPPAVIPSPWLFDDRTSDSDDLPFHFVPGETDPSQTVLEQDQECVMTGDTDLERLDSVHLIPPKEVSWYCNHGLQTLANDPSSASVDSYNNLIVLRHDLNGGGLDTGDFCFVPYRDSWVSLWMGPGSLGLASQHNFAKVELPFRVRARYLHSRFAWNVFHLIEVFLSQLLPDRLKPLLVKKDRHSEYQRSDKDGEDDEDRGRKKRIKAKVLPAEPDLVHRKEGMEGKESNATEDLSLAKSRPANGSRRGSQTGL
ncbi:hypothetical protein MSAN_00565200 [Mycena sanguinolenta]|uniref:HNH nuclease domain-containing protein n=1 Tax=Mycena sanguinolenta TaxID=230812 RepID=A0A8H6Z6N5_9AGAR|nr:hypothetical protein MSAN_00565200 [Mycena sanguinolenta]